MTDRTSPDAFALHSLLVGCTAEVWLNDVPLAATHLLRRLQGSVHATPWVVDGVNEVRLVVEESRRLELLPMGAVALDREAGAVFATARVMAGFYEDIVPDPARDAIPAEVSWGPAEAASRVLPQTRATTFTAKNRPRWAWQDAKVLDPSADADRAQVLAFVRDVFAAFARGDGAAVAATMPALARESVHFGGGPDFAAGFAGELSRVASDPDFALAPYQDEDVVLRPIAGGRVLRIEHTAGEPLLRSAPSMEASFRFPLNVAFIDGALQIARIA